MIPASSGESHTFNPLTLKEISTPITDFLLESAQRAAAAAAACCGYVATHDDDMHRNIYYIFKNYILLEYCNA